MTRPARTDPLGDLIADARQMPAVFQPRTRRSPPPQEAAAAETPAGEGAEAADGEVPED